MPNPDFITNGAEQDSTGGFTVNMPPGWAADQIFILYVATDGFTPSLSTANGFVLAQDPLGNTASINIPGVTGMHVFWKRAVGTNTTTDPAPILAAPSGGGTVQCCHINTYSNCRTSGTPFHIVSTTTVTSATTTINPPGITTTLADCTVFSLASSELDDQTFNSWGSTGSASPTGSIDSGWHSALGNDCAWAGGRGGFAAAGGPRNCTSTFGSSTQQAQISFALASLAETAHFGTVAGTTGDSTPASAGVVDVAATVAGTTGDSAPDIVGTVGALVTGSVAGALGDSTPDIAGSITSGITGTTAGQLEDSTPAATGTVSVGGSTAGTLGDSSPATTGDVDIVGSVVGQMADSSPTIAGTQLQPIHLGAHSIRQKALGTVAGFPGAGQLTTFAVIPAWAALAALTVDQGIRRTNSGNVYELIQSGTTGVTGPSGTGLSIADGTCLWKFVSVGNGACDTQSTGSAIFTFGARGTWSDATVEEPTDNKGNSYSVVDLQTYSGFPASKNGLFVEFGAAGGVGHTASLEYGNGGGSGTPDEPTTGLWEVVGGTFVKQLSFTEVNSVGNVVTGLPVTATAPAVIVVEFWLTGVVRNPGEQHLCVPAIVQAPSGTTIEVLPNATALTALSTNGYIQKCTAIFVPSGGTVGDPVPPGTYQASATTDQSEGSCIRTTAVQAVDGTVGTVAGQLGDSSPASTGAVTDPRIGTVAGTTGGSSSSISAQALATASVAGVLSDSTGSALGTVLISGSVVGVLASSVPVIAGTVASVIVGAVAGALGDSTPDIVGTVAGFGDAVGTVGGQLEDSTPSALGSVLAAASLAQTGSASIPFIFGSALVNGSVAGTLGGSTLLSGSAPAIVFGITSGILGGTRPFILGFVTTRPIIPRFMTATRLVGVWSDGGEPAPGVPVFTATPIDWPRGSTSNIEIQLVDQDGQPFDIDLLIGGNDLVLTIRQDVGSDPLLSLNAAHTGAPGAYVWALTSGMTIDLAGRLVYDVWGTRDGAQRQVVATSYFNVVFRIRR